VCAALLLAACAEGDDVELRFGEPGSEVEVRPDTPGNNLQFNFDRADLVEAFGSPGGRFPHPLHARWRQRGPQRGR
jgi:hypothetical protein